MEKREIAASLRAEAAKFLKFAKEFESRASQLFQSAAILEGRDTQMEMPLASGGEAARPRAPKGSRRNEVRSLLNLAGPLSRGEIMSQTKIPKGTLDHILNTKNGFERLPDGTWRTFIEPGQDAESAEAKLGID